VCAALKLGFTVEVVRSATNFKFTAEIVLFERINFRWWIVCFSEFRNLCRSWIVSNEFVIRSRNWVVGSKLTFDAELCVVLSNWGTMPKFYGNSEFEILFQNWVMCNELTFTAELVVQLQIWDSLSKMSWVQRNNICCRIVCAATNLGFAAEVVLSVVNLKFASKIALFAVN